MHYQSRSWDKGMLQTPNIKAIPLKFFNTQTHGKEVFVPLQPGAVTMYTCGPTVYDFPHIGNFRTYVFEDLLRRTLELFGLKVTQVMNLTDVDDKTIRGANAKNISLDEYTKKYKDAFFEDLKILNIEPAEHYPAATEYIPDMIGVIQGLLDKGFAYRGSDGSIYYALKKFPCYGQLSHLNLDELKAGASERVASDEYDKEHIADFVLWKAHDPKRDGNIFWESQFGPGRPGWHLECSVMAMKILGPTLDIHVGGVDNIFPHHENEIAQSEAYSGEKFVNLWMHSEHLIVDGKKMSKSLGNFYTLRDLIKHGFTGKQIRFMLLQTHYKTQLNFTFEELEAVKQSLTRLNEFIQRMYEVQNEVIHQKIDHFLDKAFTDFCTALADDLNISVALAAVYDFRREINGLFYEDKLSKHDAEDVIALMKFFDTVLGVLSFEKANVEIPVAVQEAIDKRQIARKEKNWKLADELRQYVLNAGYVIEDISSGIRVKKI